VGFWGAVVRPGNGPFICDADVKAGSAGGRPRLAAGRPGQARHSIGTNRPVVKGHWVLPVSIAAVRVLGGLVILLVPGSITRSALRTDRTRWV
jgi:hypothetical protein